jgi:hypothetical protein
MYSTCPTHLDLHVVFPVYGQFFTEWLSMMEHTLLFIFPVAFQNKEAFPIASPIQTASLTSWCSLFYLMILQAPSHSSKIWGN